MSAFHFSVMFQLALTWGLSLLMNPLLYIGLALTLWDLHKNSRAERELFGIRVTKVWRTVLSRWGQSFAVGLAAALLCLVFGVTVDTWEAWVVSGLCILLAPLRIRFVAVSYAASLLILLSLGTTFFHTPTGPKWFASVWTHLRNLSVQGWLGLISVSFLAESFLLWLNQNNRFAPYVVEGKRGRPIGALLVQLAFVIPIGIVVSGSYGRPNFAPQAWPFFGTHWTGYSVMALPLVIGMGAVLTTLFPRQAVRRHAGNSLFMAVVIGLDTYLVHRFGSGYAVIGALVAILGREFTVWSINKAENEREPIFSETSEGVKVLGTLPFSLAEAMGLAPGEVITHVNQVPVHSTYDLHFAFEQNPAYAKLRVIDTRGEIRMVGKPVYSGERTKLGLIVAPERVTVQITPPMKCGLLQTLYLGRRHQGGQIQPSADHEQAPSIKTQGSFDKGDTPWISQP
jgi:hypothetical protein